MLRGIGECAVTFPVRSPFSSSALNATVALTNGLGLIQSTEPCRHYDYIFCIVGIATLNSRCFLTSH